MGSAGMQRQKPVEFAADQRQRAVSGGPNGVQATTGVVLLLEHQLLITSEEVATIIDFIH